MELKDEKIEEREEKAEENEREETVIFPAQVFVVVLSKSVIVSVKFIHHRCYCNII